MENENQLALNNLGNLTKSQITQLTGQVVQSVAEGNLDPILTLAHVKKLEVLAKNIKDAIKEDVDFALDKHEKSFTMHSINFVKAATYTKYDYTNCGHVEWEELTAKINLLTERRSKIEKFLQAMPEGAGIVDENSGEILNPPIKKQTMGVRMTIK